MKLQIRNIITMSSLIAGSAFFFSCDDFLDREPLDKVTPDVYLTKEDQLASYSLKSYSYDDNGNELVFSTHTGWSAGTLKNDLHTDNMASTNASYDWWVPGNRRVPNKAAESGGTSDYSFKAIRNANYFFEQVLPRWQAGSIEGDETNIRHYIGEMYFLRAWEYFKKLRLYGDFPILKSTLVDEQGLLVGASKRAPRNEVARFILSDLDQAISLMNNNVKKTRLSKNAALLLKSRVALFEATWEKYHAGTALVPNGTGWPGAGKDYNAGYQFPSGSIEKEIEFFLTEAMSAASQVADAVQLTENNQIIRDQASKGKNPYYDMFASHDPSGYSEVIMYRGYDLSLNNSHHFNHYLYSGGNTGYTHQFEQVFLMENGLPIYAAGSGYAGDDYITDTKIGRDWRWRLFMKAPKEAKAVDNLATVEYFPEAPRLYVSDAKNATSTGYIQGKGYSLDYNDQLLGKDQTAFVVYRASEAYLNYIEASYLKNGNIDATADKYWKALRARAGVDTDYQKTINATDMSKEALNGWDAYSHGALVDATLYNIRRERRCEFIGEGFRYMDLIRWRALDQLNGYQLEGAKIFGPMKSIFGDNLKYDQADEKNNNVSSPSLSDYLRPNQVTSTNQYYNGLYFYEAHYLDPIAVQHFMITSPDGSTVSQSPIYQNPGWPITAGATCE